MTENRHRASREIRPMHFASARHRSLPAEVVHRSDILRRFSPEFLSTPERLHFHLLVHCTEGEGHHWVDFQDLRLLPQTLVYIAPGQVQQYDCSSCFEARMLVVPATNPFFTDSAPHPSTQGTIWGDAGPAIERLFDELEHEQENFDGSPAAIELLSTLVDVMRCRLNLLADPGRSRVKLPDLCLAFERLVDAQFHRRRTINWYSEQLHCTTRTLSRVMLSARGVSPKELADQRTALEAKRWLAYRNEKTAILASELGFDEPTHFSRFFLRITGETPATFRTRWQTGQAVRTPNDTLAIRDGNGLLTHG